MSSMLCNSAHGCTTECHEVVEVIAKRMDFVTNPTNTYLKSTKRRDGRYINDSETNNCNVVIQSGEKSRCFKLDLQLKRQSTMYIYSVLPFTRIVSMDD